MKVLIAGDSFAADWSKYYFDYPGWVNLVANTYDVTNCAQAGVSEYKIWMQLSKQNLSAYDLILICHTSAFRVYSGQHPFHHDGLHSNADLIYSDIMAQEPSPTRDHIEYYFKQMFDLTYAVDIHNLIKEKISDITSGHRTIHMSFFSTVTGEFRKDGELNYHHVWQRHPGVVNHMDRLGNEIIFSSLKEYIDDL